MTWKVDDTEPPLAGTVTDSGTALDLTLEHESEALEAGSTRQVKAEIRAVAFGTDAETLARQAVGSGFRFTGFLAAPRHGKHPVLHIQSFQQDT